MTFYSRREVVELLEVSESFVAELEVEGIIVVDAPEQKPGQFSEAMLERVRVAHNLVHELEVNLPGAAIILRMREDIAHLRQQLDEIAARMRDRRTPRA